MTAATQPTASRVLEMANGVHKIANGGFERVNGVP